MSEPTVQEQFVSGSGNYLDVERTNSEPDSPPEGVVRLFYITLSSGANPDKLYAKFSDGTKVALAETEV